MLLARQPDEVLARSEAVISAAMSFPMDVIVARYAQDYDLPVTVAREHEVELRRFLALSALNDGPSYGMFGAADELWHTFILFTREYAEFCRLVAGRFLHHAPSVTASDRDADKHAYQRMLDKYESVFEMPPPAATWPRLDEAEGEAGCGGGSCGGCR